MLFPISNKVRGDASFMRSHSSKPTLFIYIHIIYYIVQYYILYNIYIHISDMPEVMGSTGRGGRIGRALLSRAGDGEFEPMVESNQ